MKNAFLRPLTMRLNVFSVSKNQISMLKMGQNFQIGLQSGIRAAAPYGEPDCEKAVKSEGVKKCFF